MNSQWQSLMRSLLVSTFLLAATPGIALSPDKPLNQYRLTHWGVDDGLNHGSVHLITEDPDGFLWIGTLVGLSRFDGVSFRHAASADAQRLDYFSRSIAFGADGTWAVISEGGVARRQGDRWQAFRLTETGNTRFITARRAGGYWLGAERGLFVMTVVDGVPQAKPAGFGPRGPIWQVREEADGRLWICSESGVHLRETNGTIRHLDREFGLPSRVAWMVHRDRQGVHWLAGRNGLVRYDGKNHRVYSVADGLALATVRWIAEDNTGSLWLATPGGGVQRFRDGRFETLDSSHGLASDSVMSLHADRAGNLWLGMAGGGIARLSEVPLTVLRKRDGLTGDWIWTVHEDARGDMWVGTNGNGLTVLRGDRAIRRLPHLDTIWAMHPWDDGRAIVSTTSGVARVERNDSVTWLSRTREGETLPRVFLRLGEGTLLMARGREVLKVGNDVIGKTPYAELPAPVGAMVETTPGVLAVGTRNGGIYELAPGAEVKTLLEPQKLPIISLKRDEKGRLWAAANGLLLIDGARHVHIAGKNGFPDRASNEIVLAPDGVVWVGTNRGILRSTTTELLACLDKPDCRPAFDVLDERDGLPTAETNGGAQPGGWLDRQGRVWLPAINGLIRIDSNASMRTAPLPRVVVDGLRADGHWLAASSEVPALTRDLEIDYTLPELTLPKQVQFRYRLLPDMKEWQEVGSRRTAVFAALKPGRYRFEVGASRLPGQWPQEITAHEFELAAAWYQTWWSRLLAAAALFAALMLAPWIRFQALRARKKALEAEVLARTRDLAQANADLDRLSRTDALTGIANRREFNHRLAEVCNGYDGIGVLTVIIADIDHFKPYNDHYGHLEGDACLAAVAATLDGSARQAGALACRYGGEEFAVMARLASVEEAKCLGESLVRAVRELARPHAHSDADTRVTLSAGLVMTTQPSPNAAALLQAADEQLYRAKHEGRNRCCNGEWPIGAA